jgi:phosphonate transport system permease protein
VNQLARVNNPLVWQEARVLMPRRVAGATVLAVALVICWQAAEIRPAALVEPNSLAAVWAFLTGLFPPDFSPDFLRIVVSAAGQTIAIALAGTFLSIFVGLPLGILATPTLWQHGVILAGEPHGGHRFFLATLSRASRALLGFLRSVPDLVWGLLFVVAVGLGSLAGVLALTVSYSAVLGRVYADVFEDVDPRALEAVHATGATRAQVFLRAIWPQAAASAIAYTLYSFECCVRAASVLGFIGAGGIGYEISLSMKLFEYGQVLTLVVTLIGLVAATDAVSRFLRRRLRANAPAGSLAHQHLDLRPNALSRMNRLDGLKKLAFPLVLLLVLSWSFYATGFFDRSLTDVALISRIFRFIARMFPPDLDPAFLRSLAKPLLQTIGISVMGTLIGIAIGMALALPSTGTLVLAESDEAGKHSALDRSVRWVLYGAARLVLNILRSIPELVWVLVCILAVGLGPFAGTLAIGLHTGGVLGKLYAETLEEVPTRPLEAMRSTGASKLQLLAWGMWPQARPTLASYTVLRWDFNLRASTILGLVGGGGLGTLIYTNVQLGFYGRVLTLIAIIYILVIAANWLGDRWRTRRATL